MDLSKLTTSDKVIAAGGILLFIFSFFPWYAVEGFSDANRTGWDYFLFGTLPTLIGLVMLAVVAIKAFSPQTKLPDLPIGWGQTLFIAGVVAAVLVVLKVLIGDDVLGVDLERKFGLFLAALAAIALAVGGFLKWQEEKAGTGIAGPGSAPPSPF
ncbi:MAG: hypothetical protein AB7L84_07965 [Acidimicrobiia bacterium]